MVIFGRIGSTIDTLIILGLLLLVADVALGLGITSGLISTIFGGLLGAIESLLSALNPLQVI